MNGIRRKIPGFCYFCEIPFSAEEKHYGAIHAVRGGHEYHIACVNQILLKHEVDISEVDSLKIS